MEELSGLYDVDVSTGKTRPPRIAIRPFHVLGASEALGKHRRSEVRQNMLISFDLTSKG